jgi:hypothetical protein
MTPEANSRLPSAAQATTAKALMLFSAGILSRFLPSLSEGHLRDQTVKSMETEIARMRVEFAAMTFPEMNPVESDMWTQEALEAFDDLADQFLKRATNQP